MLFLTKGLVILTLVVMFVGAFSPAALAFGHDVQTRGGVRRHTRHRMTKRRHVRHTENAPVVSEAKKAGEINGPLPSGSGKKPAEQPHPIRPEPKTIPRPYPTPPTKP